MLRLLHLSDIHIGNTYKSSESIACKVASDIEHNGLGNIQCIIVTGDIFEGKIQMSEELIHEAVGFFETLLDEINSNQENHRIEKEDIIFVPGNHDMVRVENAQERWEKYRQFLLRFYGEIPNYYNDTNYSVLKIYENDKVIFAGFNSCQIEKKKLFDSAYIKKFKEMADESDFEKNGILKSKIIDILENQVADTFDDYGEIPLKQITSLERQIKGLDDYTVVALFHHHFYLFPEIAQEVGDKSLVRNYTEVIQHLKYMNVRVVLHGHKHFDLENPYILDDYYTSADNVIDVFAGGSVGTARKEEHTFAVLDLYEKKDGIKLIHNKFRYKGENLEPIIKKQVPPQKNVEQIVRLLEMLKNQNIDKYKLYVDTMEKSFNSYETCNKIIVWISEAMTGFTETYKYLSEDVNNILFILYAVNFRTISYMKIVGKEDNYYETASKNWHEFFSNNLEEIIRGISSKEYHNLFEMKKMRKIATECDKMLNSCSNKKTQLYIAFTMLGIFFTDLFLVLTKYADDFKEDIKHKINIKIEENRFHQNVPAPRIVIKSDADRRSAYIELLCNDATAHKMAVLFVKEFDLLINKFEDYFKIIGLKLYYLLPRIDKDSKKNMLDNYNFEAYIPTLIPLLTGENIYSSKHAFARELIQNAIDAIAVRAAKDKELFDQDIIIEIGKDTNGRRYFKISDKGMGMDRYKIERYFTSIGRSFYSENEYDELNIDYKPISNFGIGFLSSFMVCQEIDVKTKYYEVNSEGLKLHIPNYEGCFFIEKDNVINTGTEIVLYLESEITDVQIMDYILSVMQDIKYNIQIKCQEAEGEIFIPAHSVRKKSQNDELKLFVPFTEEGEVLKIKYNEEIENNNFIEKYEYGLFIRKIEQDEIKQEQILNAGILVESALLDDVFIEKKIYMEELPFENRVMPLIKNRNTIHITVDFPANWIQLDVAREDITGYTSVVEGKNFQEQRSILGIKIAKYLFVQFIDLIAKAKKHPIKVSYQCIQDIINFAISICDDSKQGELWREKWEEKKYVLQVVFREKDVKFILVERGTKKNNERISFSNEYVREKCNNWIRALEKERSSYIKIGDEYKIRYINRKVIHEFSVQREEMTKLCCECVYRLLTDEIVYQNYHSHSHNVEYSLLDAIENYLLEHFNVGESVKIGITYNEIEKYIMDCN